MARFDCVFRHLTTALKCLKYDKRNTIWVFCTQSIFFIFYRKKGGTKNNYIPENSID